MVELNPSKLASAYRRAVEPAEARRSSSVAHTSHALDHISPVLGLQDWSVLVDEDVPNALPLWSNLRHGALLCAFGG
jgi:hypothetical protein